MNSPSCKIGNTGYASLSNGILLAQHDEVVALDIDEIKVEQLNNKISPIAEIEDYFQNIEH